MEITTTQRILKMTKQEMATIIVRKLYVKLNESDAIFKLLVELRATLPLVTLKKHLRWCL